jgi:predicted extracellular nuclease
VLTNLIATLTDDNVYSYNFEGNAQVLDHVFVTRGLADRAEVDIVHVNTDFPVVGTSGASDHEPVVLRLNFASPKK